MEVESWNEPDLSKSSGWTPCPTWSSQTSPDTLAGMKLTTLLTPPVLNHACYPQSSPLHHLHSLQRQFMPSSDSCLNRGWEQLVTILHVITLGTKKVVIESLVNDSIPGLGTQPYFLGKWARWHAEENTFKTYSHLVKCWTGKRIEEWTALLVILPQLVFCNCFPSEARSIMANDMIFHRIWIWLYLSLR